LQGADGPAGEGPAYVSLSQGWAIGTEHFWAALIKDHDLTASARLGDGRRARSAAGALRTALRAVGLSQADLAAEPKGAPWKVAVAAWMQQDTRVSNGWLAERLARGALPA